MQVQPYLFFEGCAEEAIEYYRKTLGAEVLMLMRYKDSPEPQPKGAQTPPGGPAATPCSSGGFRSRGADPGRPARAGRRAGRPGRRARRSRAAGRAG